MSFRVILIIFGVVAKSGGRRLCRRDSAQRSGPSYRFLATKTAKGRAKVVDWLKTLENYTAQMAGHNDEMATYDSSWLWAELGVDELRR